MKKKMRIIRQVDVLDKLQTEAERLRKEHAEGKLIRKSLLSAITSITCENTTCDFCGEGRDEVVLFPEIFDDDELYTPNFSLCRNCIDKASGMFGRTVTPTYIDVDILGGHPEPKFEIGETVKIYKHEYRKGVVLFIEKNFLERRNTYVVELEKDGVQMTFKESELRKLINE